MTATYDISGIRRGNTFERVFRFKDSDGDAVDLTGSVMVASIVSGSVTVRKSTADGGLLNGEITLRLTPTETRQLEVGKLRTRYEIERRIGGNETTILAGCMTVTEGINNDA